MPSLSSSDKRPDEKMEILLRHAEENVESKAKKGKQTHR
jgi:hypothetical protein